MNKKKTILVFIGYYLPGYKSGGPVRTISNMLDLLGNEFNFLIITRDRDSLDEKPYKNIIVNEWNNGPNCKIFYADKKTNFKKIINEVEFDQYYLNSLFDYHFSIKIVILWKLGLIQNKKILLAPRGELMEGALSLKSTKKRFFITISNLINLYKNIIWHASTESEGNDIRREFGNSANIFFALDVPNYKMVDDIAWNPSRKNDRLRILYLSSIVPKKNLKFAIKILNQVKSNFTFDIYGPVKDKIYWNECLRIIETNVKKKIQYKGPIPNDQIHKVYPNYDMFFFPTLGENYGHVIYEALFYGCFVLTSNKVPWSNLSDLGLGLNLSLNEEGEFRNAIDSFNPKNEFNKNLLEQLIINGKKIKQINYHSELKNLFNNQSAQ